MHFKLALFVLTLCFVNPLFAAPFTQVPGAIPLRPTKQAASDLVYQGKILLPDDARNLVETKKIQDLTDLNPSDTSVIWKNEFPKNSISDLNEMQVQEDGDSFEYVGPSDVPIGRMGLLVTKKMQDGSQQSFQIELDTKSHNALLRKNLLRKIGYRVPATGWLRRAKIKFKGPSTKRDWLKDVKYKTFGEATRWVISGADDTDMGDEVVVQDVLIFKGMNDAFYNLARGDMDASVIQGRRLFNALLIPYGLTNLTENVNMTTWEPGRVANGLLSLVYEDAEQFSASYEDARWITKRILRLTRADWVEIVREAKFPDAVGALAVEKLIERRNFLRKRLKLENVSVEIAVDPKVTLAPSLVSGKLLETTWSDYATQFSSEDPDAPLSGSEIWGLFKSKTLSNVISNLITEFNMRFVPRTDLKYDIFDHALQNSAKQFAHWIATGQILEIPYGYWHAETYSGNIIAAREIIAGSYQGSDNVVQLADTIGFAADYGVYVGVDGLPTKFTLSGQTKAYLVRTYTHLKPITSIKKALKEPFRNMIVMWLKHKQANPIDQMLELEAHRKDYDDKTFNDKLGVIFSEFTDKLGVGESLVVQSSIAPELGIQAGYGFGQDLQAYLDFKNRLTALTRIHLYRKNRNVIQVYRDPAVYNMMNVSIGLESKIQVLEAGWSWIKGAARTEFYEVNINPDLEQNPKFFDNMSAVRNVLRRSKLTEIRKLQNPWLFEHDFSEKDLHFDFLFWRFQSSNLLDKIKITHPEGGSRDFIRKAIGKRSGLDYESVTMDVLNGLVDEYADLDFDLHIDTTKSGNPADTFKGKSFTRQVTLESAIALDETPKRLELEEALLSVDYKWRGWDISRNKAQAIIDELTEKYGEGLFPKLMLRTTEDIQFYSIEVGLSLYEAATTRILTFSDAEIRNIYMRYFRTPDRPQKIFEAQLGLYKGYVKKIQKARLAGDVANEADKLAKLVNLLETTLTWEGFSYVLGGEDNYYLKGNVRGFRVGDQGKEKDLFSHTIGRIGSVRPLGPLRSVQQKAGVAEGEMFIYWLLNRL